MAEVTRIGGGSTGGPRNIEIRFTMRELLLVHGALRDRQEALAKDAWWLSQRGDAEKAKILNKQADEHAGVAERLFDVLDGMMDLKK